MKPGGLPQPDTPSGRFHVLRDGFLYTGRLADVATQRNSMVVYLALSDEDFSLHTRTQSLSNAGAGLVPYGYKRIVGGHASIAVLDVCPTHYAFRALSRAGAIPQAWPRSHFASVVEPLRRFNSGGMHGDEIGRLYDEFLNLAMQRVPPLRPLDPRVREVMRILREQPRLSTAELSDRVGMSVDWLRHLFVTEAGISLRRYDLTLKLQEAAAYLRHGLKLTDVAARAGFADLAHFSKLWKSHFGFTPQRAFTGEEVVIDPMPWKSWHEIPLPSVETHRLLNE
jgi:AraC-like DNA-binding protein